MVEKFEKDNEDDLSTDFGDALWRRLAKLEVLG